MPYLTKEGFRLHYEEKGSGSTSYIFIHGTGGTHAQVMPEFQYFSTLGRAITLDLRGHGLSDKPSSSYSIETFAQDIAWLCSELKINKPVLVGASMGGNIAIEVAAQNPKIPSAIVLLDSSILYPQKIVDKIKSYARSFEENSLNSCIDKLINNSCLETDQCKKAAKEMYLTTPKHVWIACFTNMLDWDKHKAQDQIKKLTIPTLYIEADNRLADLDLFTKLCPGLITAKVVGSGHLLSLEVPNQVNPMIEQFIKIHKKT
ncbi:alpha/beta hydrolase [Candidatus Aerophobetes bacterium]|uniref:Alpha/beta hydrolase n=1 Tax=Aerophobetes bacterium TaxID=2030807 RepID=A0A2A4X1D7_UNCAE|nr:MAG: alpha/beta hydrolase [Candidatus Aerophobetes bacterium]